MSFALAGAARGAPGAAGSDASRGPVFAAGDPGLRRAKQATIMSEARAEARERRETSARLRRMGRARALALLAAGARAKPLPPELQEEMAATARLARVASPTGAASVTSIPTNVLVNNKSGDNSSDTQAEEGVAMLGNVGVCAWNDGHNFSSTVDAQGIGYTLDGGATWTDAGAPPKPAGGRWASDPVVCVNEKTSTFYYCGLIDFPLASTNGIAMVPVTFPGGVPTWGTPVTLRNAPNTTLFFDKQWMCADSSNGNVYVTYTTFNGSFSTDSILFQRSINGGANWGNPILQNSVGSSFGNVQGSRVQTGPAGEVYTCWYEIGTTAADAMKLRKSVDAGVSFGVESAQSMYANFGTGAPGFNRDHGVNFPSLAVDRSTGPHRGRVYMAYNESVNWYDDGLGGGGTNAEVESNNTTGSATPFVPGQHLTGSISPSSDVDYWSFTATQGTDYIFWFKPGASFKYLIRILCTDGVTRLSYGGDTSVGGNYGFIVWTAPANGTYYFYVQTTGGGTGTYQVETGIDAPSFGEHARDQRDGMVTFSDNGVTWSTPVIVNNDAALYDNYFSEVQVTCEGYPYSIWYDFRDSPAAKCGGVANVYISRSLDGGTTWAANQIVTSVGTNFSATLSNLQPNMGDYLGLYGGGKLIMAWADGRLGDADAFSANLAPAPTLTCPSGPTVNSGQTFPVNFTLQNANVMFGNNYTVALASEHPWTITPPSQPLTLAASASGPANFTVTAPDTFPTGTNNLTLTVTSQNGGVCGRCVVTVNVIGVPSAVPPASGSLALAGAWPNPASVARGVSVAFSLAGTGPARIDLIDLAGRRVLSSEVGGMGPGSHVLSWSREVSRLAAGMYILRLTEGGRSLTSKVVLER